ncbi:MAG: leucine-rich repeat protein [Clostridia bacterium]|nr:leucine-rich repeat protein [Clostridia bacterium]
MKKTGKTLFPILCLILAILITAPLWVLPVFGAISPRNSHENDYTAAIVDKYDRLNSVEGKKIVFVGGSSLPFGLRCDLVEKELPGYSAVDFGLYASLGTVVMMDLSLSGISEGDLVILAPETDPQLYSDYFAPRLLRAAIGNRTDLLDSLSPGRRWETAQVYYPALFDRIRHRNDPLVPEDELYSRASFDEYGDMAVTRRRNQMADGYDMSKTVTLSNLMDQTFFDEVNAYAKKVRAKGATLLFWFPPINGDAVGFTDREAEKFDKQLADKLDCPLLGSVKDTVYDAAYFYDSNYHLNDAGATLHTATTLLKLKEYLGMEETVGFEIEVPPIAYYRAESDGTFLYKVSSRDVALDGVEESALESLTTLTIPETYNDLPVTMVRSGCFTGCKNLTSLTVPACIRSFGSNVFADCPNLTEIRILGESPSEIDIPTLRMFDGASPALKVYVPKGTLSDFGNNYDWSNYSHLLVESTE